MKIQTFEDFLRDIHFQLYPMILDDDLADSFDDWIGDVDVEKILVWGELYGKKMYLAGKEEILTK